MLLLQVQNKEHVKGFHANQWMQLYIGIDICSKLAVSLCGGLVLILHSQQRWEAWMTIPDQLFSTL